MKKMALMITVVALVLWAAGNASAGSIPGGINITITFDEKGNGYADYPAVGTPLTHGFGPGVDEEYNGPTPAPSTLYYVLPTGPFYYIEPGQTRQMEGYCRVMDGDVVVNEPGGGISDVLRFDESTNRVYVYSEAEADPWGTDLADVGIPSALYTGTSRVDVTEEGSELEWNGIHYTPTAPDEGDAQPGFPGSTIPWALAPSFSYVFTSDIPEPATMSLLMLGGSALLMRRRRT